MLRLMEELVRHAVIGSARPEWTLLVIAELASAAIVLLLGAMLPI